MAKLFFEIQKSDRERDQEFSDIEKFNPYHGKDGRFTSSGGAASFTYKPGASKAHDAAIAREKQGNSGTAKEKSTSTSSGEKLRYEDLAFIGTPKVSTNYAAELLHATGWTSADRDAIEMEYNLLPDYTDKLVSAMKKQEKKQPNNKATTAPDDDKKSKKNQPEGDRSISDRKGGEIMDDIGTKKVSTSSTISSLKAAGFKRKDMKQIQRQYDLSDAQIKEISANWNKYH